MTDQKILTVIAHDPGVVNSGYAVIRAAVGRRGMQVRVLENGMIRNTIKQLKDRKELIRQSNAYIKEVRGIVRRHVPVVSIAERFMTRGLRGLDIELVSWMLCLLHQRVRVPILLTPAVTWKVQIKKWGIDLSDKKATYKLCRTTPHQFDAVLMAVYFAAKVLRCTPKLPMNLKRVIAATEKSSVTKLRNVRKIK